MSLAPRGEAAAAARALLSETARALRPRLRAPVALGALAVLLGVAQAWLIARLLASLLGHAGAGWPDLAGAALLAVAQAGLVVAQERASQTLGETARAGLRRRAMARLLARGPADERPAGERAALVTDRVEALEGYFSRYLPAARLAVIGPLLVAGAAALLADPVDGAILLAGCAMVPVVMAVGGIGAAAQSARQFEALSRLSGRFLDRVRGLPTLVLFRREESEARALAAAAHELRVRTMRVLRLAFLSSAGLEAIAAAVLACIAWRHANLLLGGTHPAPPEALLPLLLVPAAFAPLRAFSAAYHEGLAARGAAADLAPLLAGEDAEAGLALEEIPPSVVVTFEDVTLRYDPARPPALSGLSFRAVPGEALVLHGPSGAGKTSVLRLLMGLRRPDAGRIALNGRDATALKPSELRRLLSYVPQRPHLFRASLRENIRLAEPGASDARVEAAARAARVSDFADALPRGLDTLVGEGGWGLSGGQAQRVALARAFLRDRPLVLLDEPTAHLDPGTEGEVLDALRRLCLGRTAIIASHSAALRARFPRALELADGRAVASDPPPLRRAAAAAGD